MQSLSCSVLPASASPLADVDAAGVCAVAIPAVASAMATIAAALHCNNDRVVMMPKPKKFSRRTAGLHREVWEGARAYLKDERGSW